MSIRLYFKSIEGFYWGSQTRSYRNCFLLLGNQELADQGPVTCKQKVVFFLSFLNISCVF